MDQGATSSNMIPRKPAGLVFTSSSCEYPPQYDILDFFDTNLGWIRSESGWPVAMGAESTEDSVDPR